MSSTSYAIIEQDTEDQEDIPNLFNFLLPPTIDWSNTYSSRISQFGLYYNQGVFNGWVKQPSPCCAAASVAGAWNALHHYHRKDSEALGHRDVLTVYDEIIRDKINKKVEGFHRKLGYYAPNSDERLILQEEESKIVEPSKLFFDLYEHIFWKTFDDISLRKYSKELAGKAGSRMTKKVMEKVLKHLVLNQLAVEFEGSDRPIESFAELDPTKRSFSYCIAELYELEGKSLFNDEIEEKQEETGISDLKENDAVDEEEVSCRL
jgi:hypothetical protein